MTKYISCFFFFLFRVKEVKKHPERSCCGQDNHIRLLALALLASRTSNFLCLFLGIHISGCLFLYRIFRHVYDAGGQSWCPDSIAHWNHVASFSLQCLNLAVPLPGTGFVYALGVSLYIVVLSLRREMGPISNRSGSIDALDIWTKDEKQPSLICSARAWGQPWRTGMAIIFDVFLAAHSALTAGTAAWMEWGLTNKKKSIIDTFSYTITPCTVYREEMKRPIIPSSVREEHEQNHAPLFFCRCCCFRLQGASMLGDCFFFFFSFFLQVKIVDND